MVLYVLENYIFCDSFQPATVQSTLLFSFCFLNVPLWTSPKNRPEFFVDDPIFYVGATGASVDIFFHFFNFCIVISEGFLEFWKHRGRKFSSWEHHGWRDIFHIWERTLQEVNAARSALEAKLYAEYSSTPEVAFWHVISMQVIKNPLNRTGNTNRMIFISLSCLMKETVMWAIYPL